VIEGIGMNKMVFLSLFVTALACGFFSGAYFALHQSRELRCEIDGTVAIERVVNTLSGVRDACHRTESVCASYQAIKGVNGDRKQR
jgi:hypothetical protein